MGSLTLKECVPDPELLYSFSAQNPESELFTGAIVQAIYDNDHEFLNSDLLDLYAEYAGIDPVTIKMIFSPSTQQRPHDL